MPSKHRKKAQIFGTISINTKEKMVNLLKYLMTFLKIFDRMCSYKNVHNVKMEGNNNGKIIITAYL